jgi:hypothetical protein
VDEPDCGSCGKVRADSIAEIIDKASKANNAPAHGVAITRHWNGQDQVEDIVIWALHKGQMIEHRLAADVTDFERLSAHVAGFIEQLALR